MGKEPDLLLREAAQLVGLSHNTLRQQIWRGKLKAEKRGRDWWVSRKALDQYMKEAALVAAAGYAGYRIGKGS